MTLREGQRWVNKRAPTEARPSGPIRPNHASFSESPKPREPGAIHFQSQGRRFDPSPAHRVCRDFALERLEMRTCVRTRSRAGSPVRRRIPAVGRGLDAVRRRSLQLVQGDCGSHSRAGDISLPTISRPRLACLTRFLPAEPARHAFDRSYANLLLCLDLKAADVLGHWRLGAQDIFVTETDNELAAVA